jgi:hypothetical protein
LSKLGTHVTQGGRTGYGPYCAAKPAVVLAANEGGALLEAKANSGGHAFTVFRDTTVYLDAPHGIDQATPEQARQMADNHWPVLRAKWQQNPADAYTVLNEPAGHDLAVMPSYLAYELRMMELAEADGLKLCVLNLATGTPDFDVWQAVYAPHIRRAFEAGHVYGRHLYDGNGLARALQEAEWLHEQGIIGGMVITEAGLNGGYGYAVDDVVDPYPFLDLAAVPVPPTAGAIDLLPYLRGDGRAYMVRHPSGATEKFRTEQDGSFFYLVKNAQYEAFRYDNSYIWRGADTSPGPAPSYAERPGQLRYYVQREPGQDAARWCKRHMVVGETWQGPGHAVQFYYKSDCSLSAANSGAATNRTRLVAHHASRTWNGIIVPDVVELDGGPGSAERFYFARGFGLVAWASDWGQSAISEVGVTGDNQRERICGLP